jgi:orotate phosphoribosyltransferase-like protein
MLQLFLNRGASHGELAGILGMSRRKVGKILQRLITAAADPERLALVNAWRRLSHEQQRLAYLHLILRIPLHEISRMGLMSAAPTAGVPAPAASRTTLARRLRQIMRKVQRIAAAPEPAAAAAAATQPER